MKTIWGTSWGVRICNSPFFTVNEKLDGTSLLTKQKFKLEKRVRGSHAVTHWPREMKKKKHHYEMLQVCSTIFEASPLVLVASLHRTRGCWKGVFSQMRNITHCTQHWLLLMKSHKVASFRFMRCVSAALRWTGPSVRRQQSVAGAHLCLQRRSPPPQRLSKKWKR